MLKRGDLVSDILREAGCPNRTTKVKQYMTKTELMQLLLFIRKLKGNKENRKQVDK